MKAAKFLHGLGLLVLGLVVGCSGTSQPPVKTQTRELKPFSKLKIQGDLYVTLRSGDRPGLLVEAQDPGQEALKVSQTSDTLILDLDTSLPQPPRQIRLILEMPNLVLTNLEVLGQSTLQWESPLQKEPLKILLKEQGGLNVGGARWNRVDLEASGNAWVQLAGQGRHLAAVLRNQSNLWAQDFQADQGDLRSEDYSLAEVWTLQPPKLYAAANAQIDYYCGRSSAQIQRQGLARITHHPKKAP